MDAIELAEYLEDYSAWERSTDIEAAEMLRKQHEAIVKLREVLANHFYSPSYDASQAVKQALKDTEDLK